MSEIVCPQCGAPINPGASECQEHQNVVFVVKN